MFCQRTTFCFVPINFDRTSNWLSHSPIFFKFLVILTLHLILIRHRCHCERENEDFWIISIRQLIFNWIMHAIWQSIGIYFQGPILRWLFAWRMSILAHTKCIFLDWREMHKHWILFLWTKIWFSECFVSRLIFIIWIKLADNLMILEYLTILV